MAVYAERPVWYLLTQYEPLVGNPATPTPTVVAAEDIVSGPLPQGVRPPAISLARVSATPLNMVAPTASTLKTTRVQVTVIAATLTQLQDVLALVVEALPRSPSTVNGVSVDSILPDIEGPIFVDPDSQVFQGSQDFIVKYHA